MTHQHSDDDGTVIPFPEYAIYGTEVAIPEAGDLEAVDYLEGEIVDDEDRVPLTEPIREHATLFIAGVTVVYGRVRAAGSTAIYDQAIRAAETIGDLDNVVELLKERREFLNDRHARRFDRIELPARILSAWKPLVGGFVVLLILGILLALATKDPNQIGTPFLLLAALVHGVYVFASLAWLPALVIGALAGGWCLWWTGLRSAEAGHIDWLAHRYVSDSEGDPITPSIVVTAFRDLGISALRKSIENMGDVGAAMLSPIIIAGCGVELDVTLPSGTSTKEIQERRRKLAENLGRHEHEVFITIAPAARTVRLWIADSGALDEPIGPSPLVYDHGLRADYKNGRAPWGVDLRGDPAPISVYQRHLLITGLSNQGKTSILRALALWLALNGRVRFWIADLKGAGDWAMFEGIAEILIQGPTDEHVIQATHMVEDAVTEMEQRLLGDDDWDPLIVIVDEAQVAYMCPVKSDDGRPYGGTKATSRFFMGVRRLQNQGRAVDVLMWQGTQDPTDQNLPKLAREGAHIRGSLAVGTESQARMALGDKPVDGGASPHMLRQGLDKGTLVANGEGLDLPAGQSSLTIRTHYINDAEAIEIADRAKTIRARVLTRADIVEGVEDRDLLQDLEEVLRDQIEQVLISKLSGQLVRAFPGHKPYENITAKEIKERLESNGFPVPGPQRRYYIDPKEFRKRFAQLANGE